MTCQQKKRKSSKFLNKKGIAGSIMQSIGNFFQGIMHIIPKPLIFLIFLAILLLLGQLLTYIFNIFGVYCTSGGIPMTIGFNPLYTAELIGDIPDSSTVGLNDVPLNKVLFLNTNKGTDCSVRIPSGTMTFPNGTTRNFTTPMWFYDGAYCTDCLIVKITDYPSTGFFADPETKPEAGMCYGNVWKKPDTEKSWWKKWTCGDTSGSAECEPPEHYYYNYQSNTYTCDETETQCTQTTVGQKWDETLKSKGATPLYADAYGETRDISHTKMLSIQCKDLRPKLTLFGIDIFNLTYWLILMLLGIMFWALKTWL
jgi:hypothetical protein